MMTSPPEALLHCLREGKRFLVTAHRNPEGDALGATLGLALGLRAVGKRCHAVNCDGVPRMCRFMPGAHEVLPKAPAEHCDVAVVVDVDTAKPERVAASEAALAGCGTLVIIDHHASSQPTGDLNWIDPTAAAAGEMVYQILRQFPGSLSPEVALCLYGAIATDTGSFRFRNTSASALQSAAELVALGADPSFAARHLFEERPISARRLLAAGLSKLVWEESRGLSWTSLTRGDYRQAGADDEDTEGLVNFIHGIEGARLGILFRESEGGVVRISLRATPPLDVAELAQEFGGGGHALAAGCRVKGDLATVRDTVLAAARARLDRETSTE